MLYNDAVGALNRLLSINYNVTEINNKRKMLDEIYCVNESEGDTVSLTYQMIYIYIYQQKEK